MTESLNVTALGLDFVPDLVGETEAVTSMLGSGVWATATPVVPSTSVATPATRKDLRKELLLRRDSNVDLWTEGTGGESPRRVTTNNTSTAEKFHC